MWLPPLNPSDPWHPTYYERKTDAQVEHISLITTAFWNNIQNVDLVGPTQIRKTHAALISEANREARYIITKYNIQLAFVF